MSDALNLTPGRRAWLEKLKNEGVSKRARGRVGYDCMHAGLTDWLLRMPDGREILGKELFAIPYEDRHEMKTETVGEVITQAGLDALAGAPATLIGQEP